MSLSLRSTLLVGLIAAMAGLSQVAHAGEYGVEACTESVVYTNHSWKLYNNSSAHIEANEICHQQPTHEASSNISNLAVADILNAGDPPIGVEAGWRFTAPAGTEIIEVEGSDDLFKDNNNNWQVFLKDAAGTILGGQTCTVDLQDGPYCEVSSLFQASGISTSSLSIGILCVENSFHNCPDGATIHEVRAELDYATVFIGDEQAPTNVAGVGIPSDSQNGTITIGGSAVDDAAGLVSLSVVNGANEVVGGPVSVPGGCDYSFTTPCPTKAEDLAIPLDTTKLPNGQNQIRIEATNAAHDEGFSPVYTLNVENGLPKQEGGTGSPSEGGSGSGNKSDGSKELPAGSGGNELSQGSSDTSGVQSAPIIQPTPVRGLPLPMPHLTAKAVRSAHGGLIISGLVSKGATGTLSLVASGIGRDHHLWTHKAAVAIKDGRFRMRLRLPKEFSSRPVRISLSYPGSLFFGPTTVSLSSPGAGQLIRQPLG